MVVLVVIYLSYLHTIDYDVALQLAFSLQYLFCCFLSISFFFLFSIFETPGLVCVSMLIENRTFCIFITFR